MSLISVADAAALADKHRPNFNVPWRPALMRWTHEYTLACQGLHRSHPCMLAAIAKRETGGQNEYQIGMPHADGCGVGIFQITAGVDWRDPHNPRYPGYGSLMDPMVNARVAAHLFLEPALARFPNNRLAAFAAYNLGAGNVLKELARGISPDKWTTGGDYGHDVFTDWLNFTLASLGMHDVSIDWPSWKG